MILAALTTINGHVILDFAIFFPEFIRRHIAYQATSAFRAFRFDLVSFLCHVVPPSRCFFLNLGIFDFHKLYINNNWYIQFVKHRFDVNTPTLNAFIFSRSKKSATFADALTTKYGAQTKK
jgi:hypothetical protein